MHINSIQALAVTQYLTHILKGLSLWQAAFEFAKHPHKIIDIYLCNTQP